MKFFLLLVLLLSFLFISSLYISEEDNSLEVEMASIKHKNNSQLLLIHEKFNHLNLSAKDFDLDKAIKEVEEMKEKYPLDDKLKMILIELEHKRANKETI